MKASDGHLGAARRDRVGGNAMHDNDKRNPEESASKQAGEAILSSINLDEPEQTTGEPIDEGNRNAEESALKQSEEASVSSINPDEPEQTTGEPIDEVNRNAEESASKQSGEEILSRLPCGS
jgi:hypothetical protein